jgi:hypothetical protein
MSNLNLWLDEEWLKKVFDKLEDFEAGLTLDVTTSS